MSLQGYLGLFLTRGGIDLGNAILPHVGDAQQETDQEDPIAEEPERASHQEGVGGQGMSSSVAPSTTQVVKEKHAEPTRDGSQEDAGPIGHIIFTEAARKEAKA